MPKEEEERLNLSPNALKRQNSALRMVQTGKIEEMNREFDVAFWQAQSTEARLNAGWELVVYAMERQGRTDELRLQRTVGNLQRKQS